MKAMMMRVMLLMLMMTMKSMRIPIKILMMAI